jgi:hypothetical protein
MVPGLAHSAATSARSLLIDSRTAETRMSQRVPVSFSSITSVSTGPAKPMITVPTSCPPCGSGPATPVNPTLVLGVGDQAATQDLAGTGHSSERRGQQPRGQRLGGRDALLADSQIGDQSTRIVTEQRVVHEHPLRRRRRSPTR